MRARWYARAVATVAIALAGCAGKAPIPPADVLWSDANRAFEDEAWEVAVSRYKSLLDQHPFDPNAEEAELRIAQSYYLAKRFPEAIAAFENFERMHPTSGHLAMVEYHRGMSYAMQHGTPDRDQRFANSALTSFRNVIDRFPTSPWASKADLRIRECREALARHEGVVATYYLDRKSLRSAEARLSTMLEHYPDTDAAADILDRFAAAYDARGEPEPASLARATLVYHHPDTPAASSARSHLDGASPALALGDPLPDLLTWIDDARTHETRLAVPRAVSAYSDNAPGTGRPF